jgi:O-antigen/teichoic acid export membrane protein
MTTMVPVALAPLVSQQYAQRRGGGDPASRRTIGVTLVGFVGTSAAVGMGLIVLGPWLVNKVSHGLYGVGSGIFVAFGILGVASALQTALSAIATGPSALKFSVIVDSACMAINLGLSVWLVHVIGIGGPVVGSAIAMLIDAACWVGWLIRRPDVISETHLAGAKSPMPEGALGLSEAAV